jgi:hypothetical protein
LSRSALSTFAIAPSRVAQTVPAMSVPTASVLRSLGTFVSTFFLGEFMNLASDDGLPQRFYDVLFECASVSVKLGAEIPQMVIVLDASGKFRTLMPQAMPDDLCVSLSMEIAAHPQVRAVAYVSESWVALAQNEAQAQQAEQLKREHRLDEYPDRKEAIVITLVTAKRQAQMICMIDRASHSVSKAPLLWLDAERN